MSFAILGTIGLLVACTPTPKPEKQIVYVRPLTQWSCEPQEKREYTWACAHRAVSARIELTQRKR